MAYQGKNTLSNPKSLATLSHAEAEVRDSKQPEATLSYQVMHMPEEELLNTTATIPHKQLFPNVLLYYLNE